MSFSLTKLLIGRPVANREAEGRKLGILTGVPAMGLDGLGSAAYAPEAALTILAATGAAGLAHIGSITWVILLLSAILCFSYWQTIAAYPGNGGSYIVAKDNLGTNTGLLAAAALMLDYLLNVAVGISAGVGALTSAIPALHPYTLWLCLGILAAITLMNLRGTRESGLAWAVPTYLFIVSLGFVLAWGTYQLISAGGHPHAVVPPPGALQPTEAVTLWLLLRAFASGCTAMTGVEAVSNGVNAFREPKVRHAHGTLVAIVVILGVLLLGIAHIAQGYGVMAMDQTKDGYQSVLSQLVGAVYGRGWFYYVAIGSVLAVLCPQPIPASWDFPGCAIWWPRTASCRVPSPLQDGGWSTRLVSCSSQPVPLACSSRSAASRIGSSHSLRSAPSSRSRSRRPAWRRIGGVPRTGAAEAGMLSWRSTGWARSPPAWHWSSSWPPSSSRAPG